MEHQHSDMQNGHPQKHNTKEKKYTCPMHPEVISDKPGNCPKCGITLVPVKEKPEHEKMDHSKMEHSKMQMDHSKMDHGNMHGGHDHGAMIADFKKRFFVVLILTLPIVLLSPMIQQWLRV